VAYIEEIPGVNTQGRTVAEARRDLKEALTLVIEANRELCSCGSVPRWLANLLSSYFNKYSCKNSTVA
jgi:hypothetical protein